MTEFRSLVTRLRDSVTRCPGHEAFVHGRSRMTYAELWRQSAALAGFLRADGLETGDRVALLMENCPEYAAAYYGTLAAGGVVVGLNHSARLRELSCWLEHCDARWVIADARHPDFAAIAAGAAERRLIVFGEAVEVRTSWTSALDGPQGTPVEISADSLAAIIYTSGTTGRPKGVTLTHGNLAANTESIMEYLGLGPADRVLNVLPFFYSYGNSVLHTHLAAGATLILENSLAYIPSILARMAEEHATGFPGVPSTFALLLQSDFGKFDLSALRYITQAGGPMPPANVTRLRAALNHVQVFIMYGQTEATARLTYVPPAALDTKLGSAGIPIPGVEIRVCRDDGGLAEPYEVGEVCARGRNVMVGYYRDAEATARVLRDGWLHTGDMGHLDADGYLFLEGRRSDMIKSGAHRISPLDIEDVISAMPEVAEVAVVGVPDALLGESVKAVVALRAGATLDAMAIQRHCRAQLPRYKIPRTVEFAAALPRTTSGKVKRYELAEPQVHV